MSSMLAKLTTEPEQSTVAVVDKLEQLSGFARDDLRLLAKHRQHTLKKIASLGLDPLDTTAEELYRTLQVKLTNDAIQFAKAVNYENGDLEDRAAKLADLASAASPRVEVFAIKKAAAKNLLRSTPPSHLQKKLRYRSLESMLKREDASELFAVLQVVESNTWQKKFLKSLATLRASDFEMRQLTYHVMSSDKWQSVVSASHPVSYAPLSGAVMVWPMQALSNPESVCFSMAVLQAAEILEVNGLYLKNYQFQPQFGELASRLFETGEQQALQMGGQTFFDWQNLKHLFGGQTDPLKAFTTLHPTFSWWKDAQHTVAVGQELVSTHLADMVGNTLSNAGFDSRRLHNGASALKTSLLKRYLTHENVANYFRTQLDDTTLALEPVATEESISSELEAGLI